MNRATSTSTNSFPVNQRCIAASCPCIAHGGSNSLASEGFTFEVSVLGKPRLSGIDYFRVRACKPDSAVQQASFGHGTVFPWGCQPVGMVSGKTEFSWGLNPSYTEGMRNVLCDSGRTLSKVSAHTQILWWTAKRIGTGSLRYKSRSIKPRVLPACEQSRLLRKFPQ